MKIVFMGTPDFAVPCLEALINANHEVAAVFSQPDKPVGRKQIMTPPQVKRCALEHSIPVYQPEKIKGSDTVNIIKSINPDVIVVVAYGKILPSDILSSAKYGCINVHASLLPKYRGAAPIQWSILDGEEETGVSIMQMDEGLDTGDVILVKKTPIDMNETSEELFDRLSVIGAEALIEALNLIQDNKAEFTPQLDGEYKYASMISKELSPIDWSRTALEIHNQVRGLQCWPAASTKLCGKIVKIHKTALTELTSDNYGCIVDNNKRIVVCCGDGKCLEILELQAEGKKRMDSKSYLQGNRIELGERAGE